MRSTTLVVIFRWCKCRIHLKRTGKKENFYYELPKPVIYSDITVPAEEVELIRFLSFYLSIHLQKSNKFGIVRDASEFCRKDLP